MPLALLSRSAVCLPLFLAYTLEMPKLDTIHDSVKNALRKDGWTITHDPFIITYKELLLYADLAAERTIAAERKGKKSLLKSRALLALQNSRI